METEVSTQIGAAAYERSPERTAYRNGYRTRRWDTRSGTIELKIPKVSAGSYFPSLLEPRRRAEKALHAVIVEAYVKGVATRKEDDLVRALSIDGISRSEVSRICKVLHEGGPSEDQQCGLSVLRQLVKRGLKGVRLVISDAHEGLRQAITKVITG